MLIAWCFFQIGAVTGTFTDTVRHDELRLNHGIVRAKPDLSAETLQKFRDLRESPEARERREAAIREAIDAIQAQIKLIAGLPESHEKLKTLIMLHRRAAEKYWDLREFQSFGSPAMPVVPRTPPKVQD
jgi:hypothetical protein